MATLDVGLTGDQELLRDTTARFIDATCPLTRVRELSAGERDAGPDYRRQAAELGWFAMLVAEEHGGGRISDNAVVDAAIIADARGALLQPGPFVGTNVVAYALSEAGDADQHAKVLTPLLSGETSATWAAAGAAGEWDAGAGVHAVERGGGFVLSGTKTLVHDGDSTDWVLVTTSTDVRSTGAGATGIAQFLVTPDTPGVTARRLDGLDVTRSFSELHFDGVELPASAVVGEPGAAADLVDRQLAIAAVLLAAESVGAMDHDFELALEYSKARIAFGRPIGSFQAVKHLLADTSLVLEMSKAVVAEAARAVGEGRHDAAEIASMAKAFIGDHAVELAHNCWQVFGGIGYTWEHDQHLYLRRLTTDAALYGDADWHRERICRLAGL
jgi:alkylation response protein AidB-like acyl-CoA dehydrogenase